MAQLRAALERDPTGFATDDLTRKILERLNDEVARLYDEDEDDAALEEGDEGDDGAGGEGEAGEGEVADAEHRRRRTSELDDSPRPRGASVASGSPRGGGSTSRVELPKGPTPYELWRAAHEVERTPRDVSCHTAS